MNQLISFVIPCKDEEDSVEILFKEITSVIKKLKLKSEIIFVDDGSTDQTFSRLLSLKQKNKNLKIIKLRGNFGKSTALQAGFEKAQGQIIFTLDADLQDNPMEIPKFLEKINQGYDLVSGWKKKRHDPSIAKVIPSRIINFLTRKLTKVPIHDTNCGFKAYKKELIKRIFLYGELYRFIPIMAAKQNFSITEVIIEHRPRRFGQTKFGWGRGVKGVLDLLTITFLTSYISRPGHFFGVLGLTSLFSGFLIGIYITYLRITTGSIQYRQPLLILGLLLMIVGFQLITTGLLAEMIASFNQKKSTDDYISEYLN